MKTRIRQEAAQRLFDLLGEFTETDMPAYARERLRNDIYRLTEPDQPSRLFGVFVMISVAQTAWIWKAIRETPGIRNREQVRHAFDLVLTNLRMDTGEVMLTRDEIAEQMGCSPDEVSAAMGELAKLNVIDRETRRVPGMRGPGIVAYFINPNVAWNGGTSVRAERAATRAQRVLKLVPTAPKDRRARAASAVALPLI